ncbi:MAG: methyltransferase domain-containing protein [Nannocystaceae bacterium]
MLIVQEPLIQGVSLEIQISRVIAQASTPYQEVLIAETPAYGRALFLDGLIQSAECDEALYHEILVHPALVAHGRPRRVLIGGTGEGATLREVLRHRSVESVLTVDLDRESVDLCRQHLPRWHDGAFDDPRVECRIEDFAATIAGAADGAYDVIVSDVTDPVDAGPSVHLWTRPWYREIARVLADDGVFVLQAGEFDPVDLSMARAVRTTLEAVFPHVRFLHTFVPSFHALWGIAIASKRPLDLDPPDLEARIDRLPREQLQVYTPLRHRGACELPPYLARLLAEPAPLIAGPDEVPAYGVSQRE